MDEVLERFQRRFSDLRERGGSLSVALRDVARGLTANGRVPAMPLIADLRRFGNDFRELRSQWRAGGDLGPDPNGLAVEPATISELEQAFEHRVSVRSARAVLDRLDAVRLTDERDSVHWQRCLIEGSALRRELTTSPSAQAAAQAKRLVSGDHPLSAVVTLIADRDELSDERWRTLQEIVVGSFGRDLATAIVRQRLRMPSARAGVASNGL
ncbi:MAG: hypothetical protein AABP62_19240 [Planctomycetota bacterium]